MSIIKISQVLKPAGQLLFMNFVKQPSALEQKLGRVPAPTWQLRPELIEAALKQAEMKLLDFHVLNRPPDMENVEEVFYGFAQK